MIVSTRYLCLYVCILGYICVDTESEICRTIIGYNVFNKSQEPTEQSLAEYQSQCICVDAIGKKIKKRTYYKLTQQSHDHYYSQLLIEMV